MNTLSIVILSLLLGLFIAFLIALCGFLVWYITRLRTAVATIESTFPALIAQASAKFDLQSQSLTDSIARIRGDELEKFSIIGMNAAKRIEQAAVAIGGVLTHVLSRNALESIAGENNGSGLGPDDFAEETGERYISVSKNARQDQELLLRQQSGDRVNSHGRGQGYSIPNIYNHNGSSSPASQFDGSEPFDLDTLSPGLEEKAGGDE
jgi:hypothetical protein